MIRRTLVALILGLAVTAASAPALAQTVPPTPPATPEASPTPQMSTGPGEQPAPWNLEGRMRRSISEWFADLVAAALAPVFDLLGQTVLATPLIHSHDRITDLWKLSLGIADAALVVFVLFGAGLVIVDSGTGMKLRAKEALPRLLAGAAAANLSLVILRQMTEISNGLSRGIMGSLTSESVAAGMADKLMHGAFHNPFLALLGLFIIVLAILVAVAYVMRIAILVVLTAAAPLLLVTHVLPQTENWARLWWRATLALLAVPVAQSFLVVAGFQVFLSGDGLLGLSSGGLVDLLVIGCILYLLFKVPFWGLDVAMSGAGSATWRKTKHLATVAAKTAVVT
ncbi:MAG: hypothetical protein ACT4OM_11475 [Actinomycetota bacterium]